MNHPHGLMVTSIVVAGESIVKADLDAVFGVASTSTWQAKPEVITQNPEMNKEEWRLVQESKVHYSFSDAIDALISQFHSNTDRIVSYCSEHNLKISFHIELEGMDRSFVLGFDRCSTIINLAKLGAEFYVHTEKLRCLQSYE